MAFILGGGYHARDRKLPQELRREVLAKNGGLCAECNERPAVEVDHIDSDSPDPSNLQGPLTSVPPGQDREPIPAAGREHRNLRDEFLSHVGEQEPRMAAHAPDWSKQWRKYDRLNVGWALERQPVDCDALREPSDRSAHG